jgi:hypothetical protein
MEQCQTFSLTTGEFDSGKLRSKKGCAHGNPDDFRRKGVFLLFGKDNSMDSRGIGCPGYGSQVLSPFTLTFFWHLVRNAG